MLLWETGGGGAPGPRGRRGALARPLPYRPLPRRPGARSGWEGPARPGPARASGGRSSRGDRAPSSHSAHSSLSSSCNFSSALRFNLSKPEPAAADAGGGPGSPPEALCGSPAHPAGGGAPDPRGLFGLGALSPERRALFTAGLVRLPLPGPAHLPGAGCVRAAPAPGRAASADQGPRSCFSFFKHKGGNNVLRDGNLSLSVWLKELCISSGLTLSLLVHLILSHLEQVKKPV